MAEESSFMQLIDRNGKFNATSFENFGMEVGMDNWGNSCTVVSIMGPQSSGKSTLLNHLFDTDFRLMDASRGRRKTTRGIWVAISGNEPCTLVMDLEGTDGRERGENDTIFEKWSALFALAISNIVLINMWCHDIGREHAASRPLLRTVFQFKLRRPGRVTLMFVLRDQTTTPLEILRRLVLEDIETIWDSIESGRGLEEFFDVKVEALCHYVLQRDQFKKEVARLRNENFGVDRDQWNVVPASSFPSRAENIWGKVKDIRDLNIPSTQETGFNWNDKKMAAVILSVTAAFSTIGIAVGLAIPGMEGVALGMIPVVSGVMGEFFTLYRGRTN